MAIEGIEGIRSFDPAAAAATTPKADRDQFLQLMIAQLENQDPLSPQDNGEFLAQLAQFSTVQGVEDLNESFASLAGSMRGALSLQASGLVGRQVEVTTSTARLAEGAGLVGSVDIPPGIARLDLDIVDAAGATVRAFTQAPGDQDELAFAWDGLATDGSAVPAGEYRVRARGRVGDSTVELPVRLAGNVGSVSVGDAGTTLDVPGLGTFALADVHRFR